MNSAGTSEARWPEAVAAGISLIEVALGPEIAEEAFNIVMGMDTFEAACRRADARVRRDDHNERLRALVCVIAEIMGSEEEYVAKIIRRYVGRSAATKAAIQRLNKSERGT